MYLVNEQDNIALLLDLLNKSLAAALKLTSELCARNERSQVEQVDFLVLQMERNVARNYLLGDTLRNSGLSDTRLTYKAGVVFLTS